MKHSAGIEPPAPLVPLRRSQRILLNSSLVAATNRSVIAGDGLGASHDLENTMHVAGGTNHFNPLMSSSTLYPR